MRASGASMRRFKPSRSALQHPLPAGRTPLGSSPGARAGHGPLHRGRRAVHARKAFGAQLHCDHFAGQVSGPRAARIRRQTRRVHVVRAGLGIVLRLGSRPRAARQASTRTKETGDVFGRIDSALLPRDGVSDHQLSVRRAECNSDSVAAAVVVAHRSQGGLVAHASEQLGTIRAHSGGATFRAVKIRVAPPLCVPSHAFLAEIDVNRLAVLLTVLL